MTRVLSVVGRSIRVHIHDVVAGDVLFIRETAKKFDFTISVHMTMAFLVHDGWTHYLGEIASSTI